MYCGFRWYFEELMLICSTWLAEDFRRLNRMLEDCHFSMLSATDCRADFLRKARWPAERFLKQTFQINSCHLLELLVLTSQLSGLTTMKRYLSDLNIKETPSHI